MLCIRSYPLFYAIFLVKSTLQTDSLGHFFRFFQKNFFTFFHLPITLFIFSVYVSGFSLSGIGKQWITIFFTNIAIPAPAPYGASLCLLGTPQSPAKITFVLLRTRLAAWLSTHAQPEFSPMRSLLPAPPRRKEKLMFLL